MPTRLERWMRSKLSTRTAFTPSRSVPFAAQSREEPVPYSLPAMTISGVSSPVAHRRVVDRHHLAGGQMDRPVAFLARHELIAQANVGKRAPNHDLVVAAPGAIGVEVGRPHAVLDQVPPGRAILARCCRRERCGRS